MSHSFLNRKKKLNNHRILVSFGGDFIVGAVDDDDADCKNAISQKPFSAKQQNIKKKDGSLIS